MGGDLTELEVARGTLWGGDTICFPHGTKGPMILLQADRRGKAVMDLFYSTECRQCYLSAGCSDTNEYNIPEISGEINLYLYVLLTKRDGRIEGWDLIGLILNPGREVLGWADDRLLSYTTSNFLSCDKH